MWRLRAVLPKSAIIQASMRKRGRRRGITILAPQTGAGAASFYPT